MAADGGSWQSVIESIESRRQEGTAEEAWGNEPYGSNEPYEPYEPYGGKTHKTKQDESKPAERSEAERKPRSGAFPDGAPAVGRKKKREKKKRCFLH